MPSALSAIDGSPQPLIASKQTPTANVETLHESALDYRDAITTSGPRVAHRQPGPRPGNAEGGVGVVGERRRAIVL
jgi:hypothetical protein